MKRIHSAPKTLLSTEYQDEKIADPIKIRQSLSISYHTHSHAVIWVEGNESFRVHCFIDEVDKNGKHFLLKFPDDLAEETKECWLHSLRDSKNLPAVYFLIFLNRGGILGFSTELKAHVTESEAKLGALALHFPNTIFKLKRRKDERYEIPGGYDIRLEHRDPRSEEVVTQQKVFDLSLGGIAFLVSKNLSVHYPKNLIFNQMKLRLRGKEIFFSAQVKSKTLMFSGTLRECYKVGLEFVKIGQEDRQRISDYLLESQIQYLSRIV